MLYSVFNSQYSLNGYSTNFQKNFTLKRIFPCNMQLKRYSLYNKLQTRENISAVNCNWCLCDYNCFSLLQKSLECQQQRPVLFVIVCAGTVYWHLFHLQENFVKSMHSQCQYQSCTFQFTKRHCRRIYFTVRMRKICYFCVPVSAISILIMQKYHRQSITIVIDTDINKPGFNILCSIALLHNMNDDVCWKFMTKYATCADFPTGVEVAEDHARKIANFFVFYPR